MVSTPFSSFCDAQCPADFSYVLEMGKRLILRGEGSSSLTDYMPGALRFVAHQAGICLRGYTVICITRATRGWVRVELDEEGRFRGFTRFAFDQYEQRYAMQLACSPDSP